MTLNFAEIGGEADLVLSASGGGLPGGVIPREFLRPSPESNLLATEGNAEVPAGAVLADGLSAQSIGPIAEAAWTLWTAALGRDLGPAISVGVANLPDAALGLATFGPDGSRRLTFDDDAAGPAIPDCGACEAVMKHLCAELSPRSRFLNRYS